MACSDIACKARARFLRGSVGLGLLPKTLNRGSGFEVVSAGCVGSRLLSSESERLSQWLWIQAFGSLAQVRGSGFMWLHSAKSGEARE